MSVTERDYTRRPDIETLAEVGQIVTKRPRGMRPGKEVRVAVKCAGGEPAVDVRRYLTAPEDIRSRQYIGPTKEGFWLSVVDAERLCELLAAAVIEAETEIQRREDGAA